MPASSTRTWTPIDLGRRLPESGALVPAPQAVVDDDAGAQFESVQRDVDEASFDDVGGRIVEPVEAFIHSSFVGRKACCSTLIRRACVVLPVPGRPTVKNCVA